MATLVLPAPVGAQSKMLASSSNAVGYTLDWILFKVEVSPLGKADLAHSGNVEIGTKLASSVGLGGGGIWISSYCFFTLLKESFGKLTLVLVIRWEPWSNVRSSKLTIFGFLTCSDATFLLLAPPPSSCSSDSRLSDVSLERFKSMFCNFSRIAALSLSLVALDNLRPQTITSLLSISSWIKAEFSIPKSSMRFCSKTMMEDFE
ncbi:hypothetical protein WICPIJ_005131 [Wickerhamomyces pijperi]|uniref:Uncharacterized protein n=1 Tax=Wickerhamomyces pijperi TaxID=599730 RepID=A0A9P8TMN7_WICPI|nr:hypothetical protein WICPIJ_005131 [Wickerhamomyces pijperi]